MPNFHPGTFGRTIRCCGLVVAALCLGVPAMAQEWPRRPLTILVPFDAGGSADRLARGFAQHMAKELGQPITVTDRAGAGGQIGTTWFLQQPPDGYTVLITSVTSSHAANVFNSKKLPYDPINDFTPVAMLHRSYFILMVRPEAPWTNVGELTAAMRIKGDKASYGYGAPPALAGGSPRRGVGARARHRA